MMTVLRRCLERFKVFLMGRGRSLPRETDPWSLFLQGRVLDSGKGNRKAAFRCYLGAARCGHPAASTLTGMSYRSGSGVPEDPVAAEAWWRQAAALGELGAEILLEHPPGPRDRKGPPPS